MNELNPTAVRVTLAIYRERGVQFDEAWIEATRGTEENLGLRRFMKKHFRAAYYNHDTSEGRSVLPERDTSNAVLIRRVHEIPADHERCQSGDGCDREATCGRFGRKWCEHHGAELRRLAEQFRLERQERDPRAGGNHAIFGRRKKAA